MWWEETYKAPSYGNPLFEGQPLALHLQHMIARHLHLGHGVIEDQDGSLTLVDKPIGERVDGSEHWPEYTGSDEFDDMERRVALGLPPDLEEDE